MIIQFTKWTGILIAVLLGLVLAGYGGLLYINRSDEPPSATAILFTRIAESAPSADTADNALLYFIGINAPQSEDPLTHGRAWLEWSRLPIITQMEKSEPRGEFLSSQLSSGETHRLSDLITLCNTPSNDCISQLNTQPETLERNLVKVQWLIDRYEKLLSYTEWHDPDLKSPFAVVAYIDAGNLNKLYSLRAWFLAQNGKTRQALEGLNREAGFWRMVLQNNRTIIGKTVTTKLLDNNLGWTNTLLRHAPKNLTPVVPTSWQYAITQKERSFRQVFANELLFAESIMKQQNIMADEISTVDKFWNKLETPLFKIQATLNLIASNYDRINQALDVPNKELPRTVNALRIRQKEEAKKSLYRLYNPYGYILYRIGVDTDFSSYGLRITDLEGKRRMLILAASLRDKGVAAKDVPHRLKSTSIRNPYSDEAFGWDAGTESITFNELDSKTEALYQLRY